MKKITASPGPSRVPVESFPGRGLDSKASAIGVGWVWKLRFDEPDADAWRLVFKKRRLQKSCQRPAARGHRVNAVGDFRVLNEWWCMMGLGTGVNNQTPLTAPMLVDDCRANAPDIGGWIAARKNRPQKIIERTCGKLGVVDDHNKRETVYRVLSR